ncbi:MAG: NAD(P)H-hydrate dehydratase [Sphingomonas adhaesiva]|uniref:NAD(P)H-hydrate dehydratase n=1 Tax=Sphingomonas adhaesiva TaxID=28212 RepID=UPI002FFA11A9
MTPIDRAPILTAAEMRAAEAAGGEGAEALMARAGVAVAHAVDRLAANHAVLILCGPGNNGGDGYVAAARLAAMGRQVRVAATGEPRSPAAIAARARWSGAVEPLAGAVPAPVVVDALYGTGLSRPLADAEAAALARLTQAATLSIAVDVPSGVASDDGRLLGQVPSIDVTLALGAVKPAHLLQPAAAACGAVRLLDIGVATASQASVNGPMRLAPPGPDDHKFTRGMVSVVKGRMAGASHLAAIAAMHGGAGYVALLGATMPGAPHALVRRPLDDAALGDTRIGALVIGPGLGRDDDMRALVERVLATDRALVIDGDALHLVTPDRLRRRGGTMILTPHAGEFAALFGTPEGPKIEAARAAAARSGATIVFKGADTVIAAPDGRVVVSGEASGWLSTAGSGDVLAGAIGAMLARGLSPIDAAAMGVWMHGEAARRLGAAFVADDLARALSDARAGR